MDDNRQSRGYENDEAEVWGSLDRSFQQVQSVLDRNRVLIQQVNDNHQSRMVKNVALIQEINGNITKVVSLYSDLNSYFSTNMGNNSNSSHS